MRTLEPLLEEARLRLCARVDLGCRVAVRPDAELSSTTVLFKESPSATASEELIGCGVTLCCWTRSPLLLLPAVGSRGCVVPWRDQ